MFSNFQDCQTCVAEAEATFVNCLLEQLVCFYLWDDCHIDPKCTDYIDTISPYCKDCICKKWRPDLCKTIMKF